MTDQPEPVDLMANLQTSVEVASLRSALSMFVRAIDAAPLAAVTHDMGLAYSHALVVLGRTRPAPAITRRPNQGD